MGVLAIIGAAAVVLWAAALSVIDLCERRLPDALTLTGAAAILIAAAGCGRGLSALVGGLALGGLYLVVRLVDPSGLGGGDVKLAVALGALTGTLGVQVWVLGALGAPLLTAAAGLAGLARGRGSAVAHGPSMLLASLAAAAMAVL
jgi:leader peptidase (prepilin peptidase)/N-methyltransferase